MRKFYTKKLFVAMFALLYSVVLSAYDFKLGKLCYNVASETDLTVEVAQGSEAVDSIPESVVYNGKTYIVTRIGKLAFYNRGVTSITIPNSVTSIGVQAFSMSDLTSIEIPNSVTSIGDYAFSSCSSLTSVTLGNSVKIIGDCAFKNCGALTSIEIPNSVTRIGGWAFNDCDDLENIVFGDSVSSIGQLAFSGTRWLMNQPHGFVYAGKVLYQYKYWTMPNDLSVVIKDGTIGIADEMFSGYSKLTSVEIPNSVKNIGNKAFSGCSGLASVTLGNSVTSIGEKAFFNCSGLTSITIPNSVRSIGLAAFEGCINIAVVNTNDIGAWCKIDFADNSSNPLYYTKNLCLNGENITELDIPNDITEIKSSAFLNCSYITSVIIPNGLISIEKDAFKGCDNIVRVLWLCNNLPVGFENLNGSINCVVDKGVFLGLKNTVEIPYLSSAFEIDDILYVPVNPAKRTCGIINFANIGDSVVIENRSVNYKGVEMKAESILPYTFYYKCNNFKKLYINCSKLYENSILGCDCIEKITFGKDFNEMGDNVFSGCSNLKKVYCNAQTPPICGDNVFKDVDKWACELYVPAESMADYQEADMWSDFFFINEIPTSIEDVADAVTSFEVTAGCVKLTAAEGKAVAVYTAGGKLVEKIGSYAGEEIVFDKGLYIISVNGKSVKVVVK